MDSATRWWVSLVENRILLNLIMSAPRRVHANTPVGSDIFLTVEGDNCSKQPACVHGWQSEKRSPWHMMHAIHSCPFIRLESSHDDACVAIVWRCPKWLWAANVTYPRMPYKQKPTAPIVRPCYPTNNHGLLHLNIKAWQYNQDTATSCMSITKHCVQCACMQRAMQP